MADWKRSLTCFQRSAFIRFLPRSAPDKARPWPWSILARPYAERVSGIQQSLRTSISRSNATLQSDFCAHPAQPIFRALHRDRAIHALAFLLLTQLHPALLSARLRHV